MNPLTPQLLLLAYQRGIFPMAEAATSHEVEWVVPIRRGIIPLNAFHVSGNVQRISRGAGLEVRINHQFKATMQACAARASTWISTPIIEAYTQLHQLGHAHSVEVYVEGELAGGLYGVSLGGAFFGESMFHFRPQMDKVALLHCYRRLAERNFVLWDTQFYTPHLGQFGCKEISQQAYLQLLQAALPLQVQFD